MRRQHPLISSFSSFLLRIKLDGVMNTQSGISCLTATVCLCPSRFRAISVAHFRSAYQFWWNKCIPAKMSINFVFFTQSVKTRDAQASLGGTQTDASAVMAAHRRLSSATRSNDDIHGPIHSLMLSFHVLHGLPLRRLPSTEAYSMIFCSVS